MMKTDCFAYKMGKCTVLTENVCSKTECSFYKTPEQLRSDVIKAEKLLHRNRGFSIDCEKE